MTVEQLGVLDERYVLREEIGRGGMADVYRATDRTLGRDVAVKILRDSAEGSAQARFTDEARTLASLHHPGLVTLLDAGLQGDRPFLVMELVDGPTLSARVGRLSRDRIAGIGAAVAEALAHAHAAGIVHRDVKPGNILLCEDGRVLLADFGIARLVGATEGHTRVGETIGSPGWIAPEQVAGEPITPAIDVYSLGLVLLEAITGERAYHGTPLETAVARLSAPPAMPADLDPGWTGLLSRMTAREPEQRPAAREVADTLSALHDEVTQRIRPVEPVPPAESTRVFEVPPAPPAVESAWHHRIDQRLVFAGIGLLALLLVIALFLARPGGRATPDPAPQPVPAGVPGQLQQPLQDLHDAINGSGR